MTCHIAGENIFRMVEKIHNLVSPFANRKSIYIFLIAYFGFMIIPQWFRPFSPQFIIWLVTLPIILLVLILLGVLGIVGVWRTKTTQILPDSRHTSYAQLSGIGLLWFGISILLAYGTHFLYNHRKFDPEIWQNPNSVKYVSYDLTLRQRMVDDVLENVLPGSTQDEIETLLGASTNTDLFFSREYDLIYILGAERGLGVDSEWLLIWFSDFGNFERYEITTD